MESKDNLSRFMQNRTRETVRVHKYASAVKTSSHSDLPVAMLCDSVRSEGGVN